MDQVWKNDQSIMNLQGELKKHEDEIKNQGKEIQLLLAMGKKVSKLYSQMKELNQRMAGLEHFLKGPVMLAKVRQTQGGPALKS